MDEEHGSVFEWVLLRWLGESTTWDRTSHSNGNASNDTNILCLSFELWRDQVLVQRSHGRRVPVLRVTDADVQDGHAIDIR